VAYNLVSYSPIGLSRECSFGRPPYNGPEWAAQDRLANLEQL